MFRSIVSINVGHLLVSKFTPRVNLIRFRGTFSADGTAEEALHHAFFIIRAYIANEYFPKSIIFLTYTRPTGRLNC